MPQGTGNPCSKCSQGVKALIFLESSGISCGKAGAVEPREARLINVMSRVVLLKLLSVYVKTMLADIDLIL